MNTQSKESIFQDLPFLENHTSLPWRVIIEDPRASMSEAYIMGNDKDHAILASFLVPNAIGDAQFAAHAANQFNLLLHTCEFTRSQLQLIRGFARGADAELKSLENHLEEIVNQAYGRSFNGDHKEKSHESPNQDR